MKITALILGFLIFFMSGLYANSNMDSTGVKFINGKMFVMHKVDPGQGLYGIARRYGTSVSKIQEANKGINTSLSVGQVLLVPYGKSTTVREDKTPKKTETHTKTEHTTATKSGKKDRDDSKSAIYHTVSAKETLYQIAVNHHVTIEDLKHWNNLKNGNIQAGQILIVGYRGNNKKGTDSKQVTKTPEIKKNVPMKEVHESGMATVVDDESIQTGVHLAMHKSAPEGTVIKVTNPMNGRFKYVKVIANLPNTEENKHILIKIGKNTADELDIRDKVFRVDLSYSVEVSK